jgi:succinoglycan biosynthesis protein ExoM
MTSVAICIPTYERPGLLGELLRSLTLLRIDGLAIRVVVVDNDARGGAAPVAKQFATSLPGLVYEVEPQRGISAARNHLVAVAARIGADYLAFIDDDERADPSWLANLVRAAGDHAADAVGGPVLPEYDRDVPRWVREGGFFDRPRHRTGERMLLIRTGNLLIRRAWLARLEGPFDRRFDLTGGGDSHLLERLFRLGARMVWCDEALVYERVPASRGNARWILERRFGVGMAAYQRPYLLDPTPQRRAVQAARAIRKTRRGMVMLPPSLIRGRAATVRALGDCAMGIGGLLGLAGLSHHRYRQVQGH